MNLKHCMNIACGASSVSTRWRRGWVMQSGGFAVLCDKCGFIYEQSKFCDVFHCNDPGWRQCNFCGKYLHCGCIVSQYLYELHDTNGIRCAICARKARHQPVITQTLGAASLGNSSIPFHSAAIVDDEREKILRGTKFRPILPAIPSSESEANNASFALRTNVAMTLPIVRTDRHLLARYSPRTTDQELQQLSEDSNSVVVALFEKVLTPSDVGPTARIVLPKSCAEVYFPPISEHECISLEIHDVNRNKWTVQFKLWVNSSSTMYVLEGVRPFIQAMQLKPGDTVTFNRMDPKGKLMIGVRRKEPSPPPPSQLPPPPSAAQTSPHESSPKKKITERLPIVSQEGVLKVALDMATKTPIFVNRSIFMARSNRVNEQWTQCDSCSKWRKIPSDIILPPNWTCLDNIWDQSRSSCSAPNELTPMELENLLKMNNNQGMHLLADTTILDDIAGKNTSKNKDSSIITTNHTHQKQQPSGKGKHKATCTCNECMIVKNQTRVKMMQDMNRQSERETGVLKLQFRQFN